MIWDLTTRKLARTISHPGCADRPPGICPGKEPVENTNNVVFSRDGKTPAVVIVTYGNLGDPATLEVYDISH